MNVYSGSLLITVLVALGENAIGPALVPQIQHSVAVMSRSIHQPTVEMTYVEMSQSGRLPQCGIPGRREGAGTR